MVVIHDLDVVDWAQLTGVPENAKIVSKEGSIKKCIGCFGCWVKTPGQCVIADDYQKMGELFGKTDELVIISRCSFGSYSSFVKNVMDRSISYVLPYFEIKDKEMHHKARYKNHMRIKAYFYGEDVSDAERQTAEQLVRANATNFHSVVETVEFVNTKEELKGVVTW